jgi:hypothetical protein
MRFKGERQRAVTIQKNPAQIAQMRRHPAGLFRKAKNQIRASIRDCEAHMSTEDSAEKCGGSVRWNNAAPK